MSRQCRPDFQEMVSFYEMLTSVLVFRKTKMFESASKFGKVAWLKSIFIALSVFYIGFRIFRLSSSIFILLHFMWCVSFIMSPWYVSLFQLCVRMAVITSSCSTQKENVHVMHVINSCRWLTMTDMTIYGKQNAVYGP